jgi:hypothetical protein
VSKIPLWQPNSSEMSSKITSPLVRGINSRV